MSLKIITLWFSLFFSSVVFSQTISPAFYGVNSWMPDSVAGQRLWGIVHDLWTTKVKPLNLNVIRYGGNANEGGQQPTIWQFIRNIDSIRATGAEPIIQLPVDNGNFSVANAVSIVDTINNVYGRNVLYWSVGNEPFLNYNNWNTSAAIAAYVKSFSIAVKNTSPGIKIMAPDLAWYNNSIMNNLIGGVDDITGQDSASGHYYVDIISFHHYPFNGTQSRDDVISQPQNSFKITAQNASQNITAANTLHGRTGNIALTWAITEMNVNYLNPASNTLQGVGVHSFLAGQWMAEMYSIGMQYEAKFMLPWSVAESAGAGTTQDLGLLSGATGADERSVYWHIKLLSEFFKGNFDATMNNQPLVKSFAASDSSQIAVMIMNQDTATDLNYTLRLNNDSILNNDALKIYATVGLAHQYSDTISAESTQVLVFSSAGSLIKQCSYALSIHAANNMGPQCEDFITTALNEASDKNSGKIKLFPNPADRQLIIEGVDNVGNLKLYNHLGEDLRDCFSVIRMNHSKFLIDISELSSGIYFLRTDGQILKFVKL